MARARSKSLFKLKLVLLGIVTIFSVASLAFVTLAWFYSSRIANSTIDSLVVDAGISYKVKYFTGNQDENGNFTGYVDPLAIAEGQTMKTVSDYSSDFMEVDESGTGGPFYAIELYPSICHTFAIEVFTESSSAYDVSFFLTKYLSPESTVSFDYETKLGIAMSQAICIYSASTNANSDTDLTAFANKFVTKDRSLSLNDKFANENGSGDTTIDALVELSSSSVNAENERTVFFFTIEFSNDPSTYYRYHSSETSGGTTKYYYTHDPIYGSSNPYQALEFYIKQLFIHVD